MIIQSPADFGFPFLFEHWGPGFFILVVIGYIEAIDNRHTARQFALRLNVDEVLAPLRADCWIERKRHGYGIRETDTIFAGLHFVGCPRVTVALDGKLRERRVEGEDAGDIVLVNHGVSAGKLPDHELA